MSLSIGIVGLPNAGKSTLFNALLSRQIANCAPYPFCTIEPNQGVVEVPDGRLEKLAEVVANEKTGKEDPSHALRMTSGLGTKKPPIVPAIVEFVDIAGLVAGAAKGEGLGNKFLSHIRECSAIVHVLRGFEDQNVVRNEPINPKSDLETIITELCLADLQTLEKQREPNMSVASKEEKKNWAVILRLREILGDGREVRGVGWNEEEWDIIRQMFLLTAKPAIYVLNIGEGDIPKSLANLSNLGNLSDLGDVIPICAKIEMELSDLNPEERVAFLKELNLKESGLERLIKTGFEILGLQTYLTAGEKEVRAWTIKKGATAPEAAGAIHADFEKGFIKAQVVGYEEFVQLGGWKGAAEAGKVRLEGRDYIMKEGDVVEFKFNI